MLPNELTVLYNIKKYQGTICTKKTERLFFFNVLHTHTINNQKETALDRQGHNIKTQTFQTRIYSHRHCGENCYCFRTREMALYSVSVDCGIALHRDSL